MGDSEKLPGVGLEQHVGTSTVKQDRGHRTSEDMTSYLHFTLTRHRCGSHVSESQLSKVNSNKSIS